MLPWNNKPIRVVVVGDLILDEYIDGSVNRISPEAPVPIHHVEEDHSTAGGAANTARNIKLAGGEVTLIGIIGCDSTGKKIKQQLTLDHIDTSSIVECSKWSTIKKTRVTSNAQQLLRIDWEKKEKVDSKHYHTIIANIKKSKCDVIVISDYAKGLLSKDLLKQILHVAKSNKIYTIVDPKQKDFTYYQGCDLITPNLKEAKTALSLEEDEVLNPEAISTRLQQTYQLKNVLLTLGDKGMLYVSQDSTQVIYKKSRAQEVFDVSGAGDTVVAITALAIAAKAEMPFALELANLAASLVVKKWGTQAITKAELEHALSPMKSSSKVKTCSELLEIVQNLKANHKKIVFTNGCFDILHAGHVDYLEKAAMLGDVLIVGINADESIKRLKGAKRPINQLVNRQKVLAGLECVNYVVSFVEDTPRSLLKNILPHVLVKGDDYKVQDIVGKDEILKNGGVVKTLPLVAGMSTSLIIEKVQSINLS